MYYHFHHFWVFEVIYDVLQNVPVGHKAECTEDNDDGHLLFDIWQSCYNALTNGTLLCTLKRWGEAQVRLKSSCLSIKVSKIILPFNKNLSLDLDDTMEAYLFKHDRKTRLLSRPTKELLWNLTPAMTFYFKNILSFRSLQTLVRFLLIQRNVNTTHSPTCIISLPLCPEQSYSVFLLSGLNSAFLIHCAADYSSSCSPSPEGNTVGCIGTQECPRHQEWEYCKASI